MHQPDQNIPTVKCNGGSIMQWSWSDLMEKQMWVKAVKSLQKTFETETLAGDAHSNWKVALWFSYGLVNYT